jgi:hypothetical protein
MEEKLETTIAGHRLHPFLAVCCPALLTLACPEFVSRSDADCDSLVAHLLVGE